MFLLVWFLLEVFRLLVSEISTKIFDYSTLSLHLTFQHTHTHTTRTTKTHENNYFFFRKWKNWTTRWNKKTRLVRLDGNCGMKALHCVFTTCMYPVIFLFPKYIFFNREREREEGGDKFFHFQPQRRTIKLWAVGLERQLKQGGKKNGPMRQAKIKAQCFFLRRCFYWDFTANCVS